MAAPSELFAGIGRAFGHRPQPSKGEEWPPDPLRQQRDMIMNLLNKRPVSPSVDQRPFGLRLPRYLPPIRRARLA